MFSIWAHFVVFPSPIVDAAGRPLLVLHQDLQLLAYLPQPADFGGSASLFVYLGTHAGDAARSADFLLPLTSFAEQEGSFTNLQSRVQRFWPGLQPPGAARPAWLVLGALLAELKEDSPATTAGEAFDRWVAAHEAFAGLTWAALGTRGAAVNEPVFLAGERSRRGSRTGAARTGWARGDFSSPSPTG